MRRVLTKHLRSGDRIGRDVTTHPDNLPLLRAGVRVSDSFRQSLLRAGITSVWIDDGLSEGIEPLEVLTEETKQRASGVIRDAFRNASATLATGNTMSDDTLDEMAYVVDTIVKEIAGSIQAALAINDLANADGYTLKHSLSVTTLGLSLGARVMQQYGWVDALDERRFDSVEDRRLPPLGVGLLVHDIGKLAVPTQILQKSASLSEDEWSAMRSHPMEGIRILQDAPISPLSRAVVRSHHERWNGTGYPAGQSGLNIHQFARIAAVADVFDALTSDRHYRLAWPVHEAWKFIVDRSGRDFDPQVVEVFRTFVAPFPPGTAVVLSDGTCGIVKDVRPESVTLPIVRVVMDPAGEPITAYEIDLSKTPELTIVSTEAIPWEPHGMVETVG